MLGWHPSPLAPRMLGWHRSSLLAPSTLAPPLQAPILAPSLVKPHLLKHSLCYRTFSCSPTCSFTTSTTSPFSTSATSSFSTSPTRQRSGPRKVGGEGLAERARKKYRSLVVDPGDKTKGPSDLEIARKDLPENTPTLGERLDRDVYHLFHQADEKSGYRNLRKQGMTTDQEVVAQVKQDLRTRPWQALKENFQVIREEIKKFDQEVKAVVKDPHYNITDWLPEHGERRREWGWGEEAALGDWVVTRDSDWGEGYSAGELELHPLGHAVFSGELSTRVPADGRTQNAGYVNIASVPRSKSFAQEHLMDHWCEYTHLTLNLRGDGRKYMINLKVKRDFDILWNDRWHYPLFTRGGPYWQYVKIPWSKFYLGSKGKIQDKQQRVPLECGVVGISITLADGNTGPFRLEVKDIGLHFDQTGDDEDFAYEMYKLPDYWAGH